MFCVYRNSQSVPGLNPAALLPIRLGKVLRVAREVQSCPFVVVESWWPISKPQKYGDKTNLFGTWVKCAAPIVEQDGFVPKKSARSASKDMLMIPLSEVLVWPLDLDAASSKYPDGGRLPFAALHCLRTAHGVDLADPAFTFAKRGKAFYFEVVKRVAQHAFDSVPVADKP